MKTALLWLLSAAIVALAGCGKKPAPDPVVVHAHEHVAPHGGTAVVLGDEAFHLELLRDAAEGTLTAWVLDGEMENFIRVAAPEIELRVVVDGRSQTLSLFAVGSPATGETEGDTSEFVGQADWLKTTAEFDAELVAISIRGVSFAKVRFNFPRGNEVD